MEERIRSGEVERRNRRRLFTSSTGKAHVTPFETFLLSRSCSFPLTLTPRISPTAAV